MDEGEMRRSAQKKALDELRKLGGQALIKGLKERRAPPPSATAPEQGQAQDKGEMNEDDARQLIEMYSKQEG